MNFVNEFFKAAHKIHGDDLAYIIRYTKAEKMILGRIGYHLSKVMTDYRVAIEENRADLKVLKDEKPIIWVEVKQHYSSDEVAAPSKQNDIKRYNDDLRKLKRAVKKGCDAYFILFIIDFDPEYPMPFTYSRKKKNTEASSFLSGICNIFGEEYIQDGFHTIGVCDSITVKLKSIVWRM